ncbi:MAG TPA: trypsin-like peptidase domain-containing protein [Candidatus Saccharimonadales bacterium]|nr:trypsin-like peptidase domain-containing protein [Candidatus Saccharimonadales bacterium]
MAFNNIDTGDDPELSSFSTRPSKAGWLKLKKPAVSKYGSFLPGRFIAGLLAIFLVGFGGGWLGARTYNRSGLETASTAVKQQYISNESSLISSIAKTAGASVVSVDVTSEVNAQDFFGFSTPSSQESAGTGFIISPDGTIVTNRHVVPAGTSSVSVTLADGTRYNNVQVIGRTSDSSPLDVAFLKITDLNGKKLTPLNLGDSSKMQVGDKVIAIGNALGQFQNTVTAGIISGYGRDVVAGDQSGTSSENLTDLFQTDAAINEGNSGGPLVDINGEAIGINTAVAGDAQNIGFAIPINDVKGLIASVLGEGKLEQPYLGVRYVSLTDDLAYQYNLSVKRGAYIVPAGDGQDPSVIAGSPADKAGLKEKDIITKVNNTTIDDKTSLTSALSRFKVGDKVTLTIVRGGKTTTIQATLAAAPSS